MTNTPLAQSLKSLVFLSLVFIICFWSFITIMTSNIIYRRNALEKNYGEFNLPFLVPRYWKSFATAWRKAKKLTAPIFWPRKWQTKYTFAEEASSHQWTDALYIQQALPHPYSRAFLPPNLLHFSQPLPPPRCCSSRFPLAPCLFHLPHHYPNQRYHNQSGGLSGSKGKGGPRTLQYSDHPPHYCQMFIIPLFMLKMTDPPPPNNY